MFFEQGWTIFYTLDMVIKDTLKTYAFLFFLFTPFLRARVRVREGMLKSLVFKFFSKIFKNVIIFLYDKKIIQTLQHNLRSYGYA